MRDHFEQLIARLDMRQPDFHARRRILDMVKLLRRFRCERSYMLAFNIGEERLRLLGAANNPQFSELARARLRRMAGAVGVFMERFGK